jgi:hypothetical protein
MTYVLLHFDGDGNSTEVPLPQHELERLAGDPPANRITLTFATEEELHSALAYIGDGDAPMMITDGLVETRGKTYRLWDDYGPALTGEGEPS